MKITVRHGLVNSLKSKLLTKTKIYLQRFVFDLIDDMPKPNSHTVATNTHNNKKQINQNFNLHDHKIDKDKMIFVNNVPESNVNQNVPFDNGFPQSRVDVYYFDHGNAA